MAPSRSRRYALQITIGRNTHDMLRYAQDLLSHQIPKGDLADVLHCVLEMAIGQLESASSRRPPSPGCRTVPRPAALGTSPPRLSAPYGTGIRAGARLSVRAGTTARRASSGVRSREPGGSRRQGDNRELAAAVSGAQSVCSRQRLRDGFHERQRQEARRATIEARKAAKLRSDERAEEQAMKHVQTKPSSRPSRKPLK